jgi:polygalacturonase
MFLTESYSIISNLLVDFTMNFVLTINLLFLPIKTFQNLGIFNSNNINITSLTSRDSQMFHMEIDKCQNVKLERVTILAPGNSPNTDGIHIQASSFISIFRSNISTGDDCVSIGPGSNYLWMENVSCGPGHGIR